MPAHHRWIRHADYYVAPGEVPGVAGAEPSDQELHRGHWGWLRRAPSLPAIWWIKFWRKLISPVYGDICSFYPSCSAYGLEAVTSHGLIRGSFYTVWRILRCNPFTGGGIDHVPVSSRIWQQGDVPGIIELNHPPMDDDQV